MTGEALPFARYLAAKRGVDDRSLNRRVWETVADALGGGSVGRPLRVLEVGAGIGTMVERLVEWNLFNPAGCEHRSTPCFPTTVAVSMTAIDVRAENVAEARRLLQRWAVERGFAVAGDERGRLVLEPPGLQLTLELEATDLFDFAAREHCRRAWDLVIAHAVLDELDLPTVLPALLSLAAPGALCYFSMTFDGVTTFEPRIDPALDDQIEHLYHLSMDRRIRNGKPAGDSRAGRHLFFRIREAGAEVLDMGGSDWVIFPGPNGYRGEESTFLHFIVHTIHEALAGHPELDPERFADWVRRRHAQIKRGELVYIAHQLDLVARAR